MIASVGGQEIASLASLLNALDAQTSGSAEITLSRQKQLIKLNFTR
ncbi:MAG: hypothetical protein ACKVX9_02835 [Blastocatellia bacterium]